MSLLTTDRDGGRVNKDTLVGVRIPPALLRELDRWNAGDMSRPEAIRQLLEHALIPKPGALVLSPSRVAAIAKRYPEMPLPDAIAKLIEIGLKEK